MIIMVVMVNMVIMVVMVIMVIMAIMVIIAIIVIMVIMAMAVENGGTFQDLRSPPPQLGLPSITYRHHLKPPNCAVFTGLRSVGPNCAVLCGLTAVEATLCYLET